ncbi:hypothetical protein [Actinoallomurus acaciae]|uniref:Uncharacterized protein n=1 Tax=Actinoallomurus acaciae TaxID=502577 RepID=A0ABV5YB81_9ACTN
MGSETVPGSADTGNRAGSVAALYAKAHGKYKPHLVTSCKITGGGDSVHDIQDGTLQIGPRAGAGRPGSRP